jgi:hypothetical protein
VCQEKKGVKNTMDAFGKSKHGVPCAHFGGRGIALK